MFYSHTLFQLLYLGEIDIFRVCVKYSAYNRAIIHIKIDRDFLEL